MAAAAPAPAKPAPGKDKDDDVVIRVSHLQNSFGDQVVHKDVNLEVRRGEILGVVGGSGTGKSVLMRSIIGLQQSDAGEITVLGEEVATLDPEAAKDLRRRWGVLFQGGALFSSLTVAENIEAPMREFFKLDQGLMDEIASYKIAMVGLPELAGPKFPSELSGGMRKRAGLARALALDPDLLFLDEPTAGLDPIGAAAFDELIKGMRDTLGLTVFLITHDLDTLYAICDRVAVLGDGVMLKVGTIPELLEFDHPWVREYFSGPRGRAAAATDAGPHKATEADRDAARALEAGEGKLGAEAADTTRTGATEDED
ncbi:ABC transporter ATP-binding protein [Polymorphobacter sp. PAMC 29334]|uniref:ABC transporter ATP-binding protein n=1 Tax=Polymorphobacter sp. PAMC 29334 TaxID=2862331 RepID=UPI001C6682AE|nr:ABC transporter ATP-binding protein [Polymorphobacter sp. PAMC 29334]QYE34872.1 ABC transporter ATP-binding protein [Polymorphobacter sp. PAMC 29334]